MSTDTQTRKVKLICGANEISVDLPQGTITARQLFADYATTLNIPGAREGKPTILVNDAVARDNQPIQPGDTVEMVREASEKG